MFGFDNAGVPLGYESAPIDWYAVPRFDEVEIPSDDGCVLVFAETRNQARSVACKEGPWCGWYEYPDFKALRVPAFDQYAEGEESYFIEFNRELPEGAEPFFDEG